MAEPFPRASPGVPPVAMALRLGAGPAKAAPTLRSARSIFPAAHVAGKNDPDSFRLAPETRKGCPLPGPFPGGRGTGVPGQLPASIGSTCCPPGRLVASAAGGCRCHKSLRLPCVKGAGARRATEGLSAETSPEALSPGNISPPDCRVPSGPMQAAGAENASPQCLPLPPFRGRLPGGRGMASHFLSSNGRGSGEFRRTLCRSAPSCRVSLRRAERIKEILISP